MMPKFSVITPVHVWNDYRAGAILRAIESIKNQTYRDFEYIIVNDGSTRAFEVPKYDWLKVIDKVHEERVAAYNEGFRHAAGEWITILDSDDEYAPTYLERFAQEFRQRPRGRLFNCGAAYSHRDGDTTTRSAFKPKRKKKGHEVFGGGNIVNGTFVFHSEIYQKEGAYPDTIQENIDCTELNYGAEQPRNLFMWTPYDFSAYAQIEFPEIRQYFMVDHVNEPNKIVRELGNPWGNDYYLFYKYTRKYHSYPFDDPLYIVHPKGGIE